MSTRRVAAIINEFTAVRLYIVLLLGHVPFGAACAPHARPVARIGTGSAYAGPYGVALDLS